MKLFIGIYNSALSRNVEEILERVGTKGWTLIPTVYGRGSSSTPRLGTHVWPGENKIVLVLENDEKVKMLFESFSELKKRFLKEGVKAFILDVLDVI